MSMPLKVKSNSRKNKRNRTKKIERILAIAGLEYAPAFVFEREFDDRADRVVVFDGEYLRFHHAIVPDAGAKVASLHDFLRFVRFAHRRAGLDAIGPELSK